MKNSLFRRFFPVLTILIFAMSAFASPIEDLTGTWTLTRTNDDHQVITQTLEIKKDKFTFRVTDADQKTVLYALGDVKVETASTPNTLAFLNLQAGSSATDTNPVNDDRRCPYLLDGNTLTLAVDLDKKRDQSPRIETYTKKDK